MPMNFAALVAAAVTAIAPGPLPPSTTTTASSSPSPAPPAPPAPAAHVSPARPAPPLVLAAPAEPLDQQVDLPEDGEALAADPDQDIGPAQTVGELSQKVQQLETQLAQTQALVVGRRPNVTIGGYVDFGFFAAQGNGSGIVRDSGNQRFPKYQGRYGWVFLGDLLSPTVNSRGEAADLGEPAGVSRFDSIHSGGAPGFILNEINLATRAGLGNRLAGTLSVNFVPRSGQEFSLGDLLDVDLAQLEWMPTRSHRTSIFVGKIEPVIGIEYRERKSSQRFGITPSLMGRYTMGTALGLKVRSKFGPSDNLIVAAAVTNGSNTTEQFHFYEEIDRAAGKTASGRLALRPPPLSFLEVEVGASGSYGAQDRATNSREPMWFVGLDMLARIATLDLKAQWLRGGSKGWGREVYGLDLRNGGYLELDWMLTSAIGLIGRGEFRDALVWLGDPSADMGANRAYLTKSWRATGGARVVFSDRVVLKAEYLRNGEYGGIPGIRNDVFTSSLVFMN
jgi:hypothetical protein